MNMCRSFLIIRKMMAAAILAAILKTFPKADMSKLFFLESTHINDSISIVKPLPTILSNLIILFTGPLMYVCFVLGGPYP